MPETFVHDTSRMNREAHVRLCKWLGAEVYGVPTRMAHGNPATAWSWPSPISNSLPATPRDKESSRPACRPVGGEMSKLPLASFALNAFGIRASAAAARRECAGWSDPRHPSGCPASIIPRNRDTWRLRLLRRDRTGTCRDQRCVDLGSVKHAVAVSLPFCIPLPALAGNESDTSITGADWDRGHAQSGEGMLARTAQSVDAERVRDRAEG
jgi:hypothetical protein